MNDTSHHINIAEENLKGAIAEFKNKRFTNVGLLSLRALEQMIEACASKEGLHFHEQPRTAHKNCRNWLKIHNPDLLEDIDEFIVEDIKGGRPKIRGHQHLRVLASQTPCIQ